MGQDADADATWLRDLAALSRGSREGLFGPGSATWTIVRENGLFLAGGRALLLQLAHPAVASAVHAHSRYKSDVLGRAVRTFNAMYDVTLGDEAAAIAAAIRVKKRHMPVSGTVDATASPWRGAAYHALDPKLLLWVHATLIHSSLLAYETLLGPLPTWQKERFYLESQRTGRVFGLRQEDVPESHAAFERYFQGMLAGSDLEVTPYAAAQADDLLRAPPSAVLASTLGVGGEPFAVPKALGHFADARPVKRLSRSLVRLVTAHWLPDRLRIGFGLPSGPMADRAARAALTAFRAAYRVMPSSLRDHPAYRQAMTRVGAA